MPGYDRYLKYAQIVKDFPNPLDYLAGAENCYWGVRRALPLANEDGASTKVLEIGSGLGYLTYSLRRAGYDAVGLDISENAVKAARASFGDHYVCADVFRYSQLHPGSFDVVIMTDVIEHIDRPVEFLGATRRLLKPGGRIVLTTPNKSFYSAKVLWISDLPPVHCWWFSEQSMRYISKTLHTNIEFINFREYYKDNYHAVRTQALVGRPLPRPYLDRNGELIVQNAAGSRALRSSLIKKIPYAQRVYGRSMEFFTADFNVCRDRGILLCAIMERPH